MCCTLTERMHYFLSIQLITAAVFLPVATCAQYRCQNRYEPQKYARNRWVPLNCREEPLIPKCPRSWKSGIPLGQSTAAPLIDVHFIQCHEGFLCCGYVPINYNTGEVLDKSAVTIGSGVDLGLKTGPMLKRIGVPDDIAELLDPYYGLRRNDAACAAIEKPLKMQCEDAQLLTTVVKDYTVSKVQQRYDREKEPDSKMFSNLPRGIRTAIADVWFQSGEPDSPPPNGYPIFWGHVIRNDWKQAIKELRNYYRQGAFPSNGELRRRNNEADILEAALAQCNRSADIVFLLDESGSIQNFDFESSLNFTRRIINAFPEETLKGEKGTRFGLSLFNSRYRNSFFLSTYKSKAEYSGALDNVTQRQGGTRLGSALSQIIQDQFVAARGLRPESYGFPKILVVLTDGKSQDNVSNPAKTVRKNNTVIYAIGIGGYDIDQLHEVASSPDHVKNLTQFSDLADFAATLTAATCYEPQPVSVGTTITSTVQENNYHYYTFDVEQNENLEINIEDTLGSTFVYASRTNSHPYEHDYDFGFTSASLTNKVIIIGPADREDATKRQALPGSSTYPIYVSITAVDGTEAAYVLKSSTCDPAVCSEGTNEQQPDTPPEDDGAISYTPSLNFLILAAPMTVIAFLVLSSQ